MRRILTVFAVTLVAAACVDHDPAGPSASIEAFDEQARFHHRAGHEGGQQQRNGLLSGIPVAGTLADGTFEGLLDITGLAISDGQLLATGTLTGTATQLINGGTVITEIVQQFTDLPINLLGGGGPGSACRILFLEIPGGLMLDLLGLVVDLAPVELEVRAERGPGNLLGNLLCAVVGLLDGVGSLSGLLSLLDRINQLL